MAEAPENARSGQAPQRRADPGSEPGRDAGAGGTDSPGEELDPREEEGWTQPESSAQKGAPLDEG